MYERTHINFKSLNKPEGYTSKKTPITQIPKRNAQLHGNKLLSEFKLTEQNFINLKNKNYPEILSSEGIYIVLKSDPTTSLPLNSIDSTEFILSNLKILDDKSEEATIFIPEKNREKFLKKITAYIETINLQKNPKNMNLINNIASIKLARLEDFWTDPIDLFPVKKTEKQWWEVWLKKSSNDSNITFRKAIEFAEAIQAEINNSYIDFFDNIVVIIKTTAYELEKSIFIMSNLLELRQVHEPASFFVDLNPKEQYEWVNDLNNRVTFNNQPTTSICILDGGINFNHPLLSNFTKLNYSVTYDPSWPPYDVPTKYGIGAYNPHGSMQAGIAVYRNLKDVLLFQNNFHINHIIESGRILPPKGQNKPELYGSITINTAYKIQISNPEIKYRIYSLAVTSDADNDGKPSSWSGAIDKFIFGEPNEFIKNLFIISTGNNRALNVNLHLWDQAHLAKIEDPAHSWNSITVGTFTNLATIVDPKMNGWKPWASRGDICPTARTSVNWTWIKNAPLKPEFVLEGGNRLLSPNPPIYDTNHDDVSILTTSGDVNYPFDCHTDSSAASALASNYAALIADKYPKYWPETIRGLLIHSCQYTKKFLDVYSSLEKIYSEKKAIEILLRTIGYGVPNLEVALNSANNHALIVIQDSLKPFKKNKSDIQFNEMQVINLPWPKSSLAKISDKNVELKVTLSYFIEPNPQSKGFRSKYAYPSCGLRFKMLGSNQTLKDFKASLNRQAMYDDYDDSSNKEDGWFLGPNLRTKGSIHSDTWRGTAADLMTMNHIAIYPVTGWWKSSKAQGRWKNSLRYSIIISIKTEENISIYNEIENEIKTMVEAQSSLIQVNI